MRQQQEAMLAVIERHKGAPTRGEVLQALKALGSTSAPMSS